MRNRKVENFCQKANQTKKSNLVIKFRELYFQYKKESRIYGELSIENAIMLHSTFSSVDVIE